MGRPDAYPFWAWLEKPKEDYFKDEEICYLLELEIEDSRIFLSDFHAWHSVLNNDFVEFYEDEFKNSKLKPQDTWERIFCLDELRKSSYWYDGGNQNLQATFFTLHLSEVMSIKKYH